MIGATGVGKTEIARRLAKLARAPFLKVEASKFTEVGYVGRDCESMIRDLMEISVAMVKDEKRRTVQRTAAQRAEDRLLQLLVPQPTTPGILMEEEADLGPTREKFRTRLRSGKLDERQVEIEVGETRYPSLEMFTPQGGVEEVGINLKEMMPGLFGRRRSQKVTVAEAREIPAAPGSRKVDRSAPGGARGRTPGGTRRADFPRRDRQGCRSRGRKRPGYFPARESSATCCRSSKAPL